MTYHLQGASTLAEHRGSAQFNDDVGHGIYARMRGFLVSTLDLGFGSSHRLIRLQLAHCLQTREPLPPFILEFLDNDDIARRDFEPAFYKLLARLCQVRADQKNKGLADAAMAQEAEQLMNEFEAWQPTISDWQPHERPSQSLDAQQNADDTYRFVWLATIWIFKHSAQILACDLVIEWAQAQVLISPGSPASNALDNAVNKQIKLCDELKDSTNYYLDKYKGTRTAMRTVGGYGLLWPLYVLSTSSTSTSETMLWVREMAEKVADEFGIKQGKAMADFMKMYTT